MRYVTDDIIKQTDNWLRIRISPLVPSFLDVDGSLHHRYLLATCGNDNVIKLWHVVLGQYVKHLDITPCELSVYLILEGHTSAMMCVRFSPGGSYLASSSLDKTVRIWEVSSLKYQSIDDTP
jgi:WD40 repeat protein